MESEKLIHRSDYSYFHSITTRWSDNDIYGHVNNVVYYSYFDTVANQYLIEFADFKPISNTIIGVVVHSNCTYIKAITYPDKIEAGLIVKKLGKSSVTYGIGIFKKGEKNASAYGEFVHVFVNRKDNQPTSIPEKIKEALQKIL
ncbi:acyl-CoA thioesterase [Flavobacteriaceae bacterium]|nr:acyl-CoA thioesterase [Flavobacteriaceae bacterium]MDB2633022.1 acyl-CoA thioesterase [Flavobacteriaceae bacterium]